MQTLTSAGRSDAIARRRAGADVLGSLDEFAGAPEASIKVRLFFNIWFFSGMVFTETGRLSTGSDYVAHLRTSQHAMLEPLRCNP